MAKLLCPCGHVLSTVAVPNDVEHVLVSDHTLDALCGETKGETVFEVINDEGVEVWKCTECGRMAVFADPILRHVPIWYVREMVPPKEPSPS